MATLGTAYIQVLPSTEGISAQLQQGIGTAGAQAGKSGGMIIGSAMKKFISAAAIGAAIKKSVEEGAKLEQSLGGVETLYKKHANTVIKNASKAYKTAGLSANDYMEQSTKFAASLLQSLGGDTAAAAKYADMAIIDMSDNANKFGTSITDIQNAYQGFSKQNYTMLDNLKLGYGGTKTEMERLLADASKLSGQEYDISSLADVYDAIHVIQTEMDVTGTTSKEAASTLSGSFASMKAAATNFLGNLVLGKNIESSMQELVSSTSTFLFDNLIPAIMNIAQALPPAFYSAMQTAIPQLAGQLPTLITQIFNVAKNIVDGLTGLLDGFFENLSNDPGAQKAAIKLIGKICAAVVKGAIQLTKAGVKLCGALVKGITGLEAQLIKKAASAVASFAAGLAGSALAKVKAGAEKIKEAMLKPIEKARTALRKLLNKIKGMFPLRLGKIFNLKLPHFSVSGGKIPWGVGGKGKMPNWSVSWYKKGAVFDNASVIGVGEAGKEAVVPLSGKEMKPFADAIADNLNGTGGNTYYFGDITLDVSSLEDVATIEDIAQIFTRAKAFA